MADRLMYYSQHTDIVVHAKQTLPYLPKYLSLAV